MLVEFILARVSAEIDLWESLFFLHWEASLFKELKLNKRIQELKLSHNQN
jgi:hypothetical protein